MVFCLVITFYLDIFWLGVHFNAHFDHNAMSKLGNEVPKECDDDPSIKQIGSELKHEKSFVKLRTKDFHME